LEKLKRKHNPRNNETNFLIGFKIKFLIIRWKKPSFLRKETLYTSILLLVNELKLVVTTKIVYKLNWHGLGAWSLKR